MPDDPVARRLLTVPAAVLSFCFLTVASPLVIGAAAAVDLVRFVVSQRPWITTRAVVFLWFYLLGQMWALLALLLTAPLPRLTKRRITYELQTAWTRWNIAALRSVFSISFVVEGQEAARRGPMILISRHASMVDTMLPAYLIANEFGIRLRYVLKRELLVDPTLDIAGHRLPNYFIDRSASDVAGEVEALRRLASGLTPEEGVLIYPEGTRFSERKRRSYVKRVSSGGGHLAEIAESYRAVLPPRPGGTLALLDTADADVVVLAHHGLEGLATIHDIWRGHLVGTTVRAHLWRIPAEAIPTERKQRIEWLFQVWARVDDWVVSSSGAS